MGVNYNKQTLGSGYASTSQLQDAEDQTEQSFEDALSRTGSGAGSNAMETDLDMNGNDILNAGTINGLNITADSINVGGTELTGGATVDATANYDWTGQHTYTLLPTVNGSDVVTQETLRLGLVTINTQTASYVAQPEDQGALVLMNVGAVNTFTVPDNATVPYAVGAVLSVCQYGSGATTIQGAGGVTINTEVGYQIISRYGFATLVKIATDEWLLSGSLQASA